MSYKNGLSTFFNISLNFSTLKSPPEFKLYFIQHFLQYNNLPFVIVFSKVDKLGKTKLEQRKEQIEVEFAKYNSVKKIFFSSVNGNGLDELKALISKSCEN